MTTSAPRHLEAPQWPGGSIQGAAYRLRFALPPQPQPAVPYAPSSLRRPGCGSLFSAQRSDLSPSLNCYAASPSIPSHFPPNDLPYSKTQSTQHSSQVLLVLQPYKSSDVLTAAPHSHPLYPLPSTGSLAPHMQGRALDPAKPQLSGRLP